MFRSHAYSTWYGNASTYVQTPFLSANARHSNPSYILPSNTAPFRSTNFCKMSRKFFQAIATTATTTVPHWTVTLRCNYATLNYFTIYNKTTLLRLHASIRKIPPNTCRLRQASADERGPPRAHPTTLRSAFYETLITGNPPLQRFLFRCFVCKVYNARCAL